MEFHFRRRFRLRPKMKKMLFGRPFLPIVKYHHKKVLILRICDAKSVIGLGLEKKS